MVSQAMTPEHIYGRCVEGPCAVAEGRVNQFFEKGKTNTNVMVFRAFPKEQIQVWPSLNQWSQVLAL